MDILFVTTAVVAVTEFLKRLDDKDTKGALTIILAAAIGGVAGLAHVEGLSIVSGILAGLSAAGIHTVARQIG